MKFPIIAATGFKNENLIYFDLILDTTVNYEFDFAVSNFDRYFNIIFLFSYYKPSCDVFRVIRPAYNRISCNETSPDEKSLEAHVLNN